MVQNDLDSLLNFCSSQDTLALLFWLLLFPYTAEIETRNFRFLTSDVDIKLRLSDAVCIDVEERRGVDGHQTQTVSTRRHLGSIHNGALERASCKDQAKL